MTRAPGIDLGQLGPLWFSNEVLSTTIDRVNAVQDVLGKPLVLENVTYVFHRLTGATGCGILLDVTNVYTNAADSHSHPVPDKVWDLFSLLCKRVGVTASLLEFDQNFPDFSVLIDQVATARQIMSESATAGRDRCA